MQIRYYSFSTFAQNETMLTTTLILKNPIKRQANQKRPVLRSCFQFLDFFEVKVEFEKKENLMYGVK